jgi:hypothetical protein
LEPIKLEKAPGFRGCIQDESSYESSWNPQLEKTPGLVSTLEPAM